MAGEDKKILVYDDFSTDAPILLGKLYVGVIKGGESYSFEYDKEWLTKNRRIRFLMKVEKKNEDSYYTWSEP